MEMKTIVAAVLWNFDVEVLEGQSIKPKLSIHIDVEVLEGQSIKPKLSILLQIEIGLMTPSSLDRISHTYQL